MNRRAGDPDRAGPGAPDPQTSFRSGPATGRWGMWSRASCHERRCVNRHAEWRSQRDRGDVRGIASPPQRRLRGELALYERTVDLEVLAVEIVFAQIRPR